MRRNATGSVFGGGKKPKNTFRDYLGPEAVSRYARERQAENEGFVLAGEQSALEPELVLSSMIGRSVLDQTVPFPSNMMISGI